MSEPWFGKSWRAECCEASSHVATPVGRLCLRCREPVLMGAQGLLQPCVHGVKDGKVEATLEPIHLDCLVRSMRPHGPECPHCRGKSRWDEHHPDCQRKETGICSCVPMPEGKR